MGFRTRAALLAIALAGLALRLLGLYGSGGPIAAPTSYDDGVYFSASALFVRGTLPYRDFVFVHPPGLLYFLATTSWWPEPAAAFTAARVLAGFVGAANILLLGAIVMRTAGPLAGVVAAGLYAIYPDAVIAERSPYLEPVLNLFCLASTFLWLRHDFSSHNGKPRPFLSGLLMGAACAVKLWGGIWVIAAIVATSRGRFRSDVPRFIAGACTTGLLLLGPLVLAAPRAFLEQVLIFQVSRPPDGLLGAGERLREILDGGHRAATVLAAIALIALLVSFRQATRAHRLFGVAALLTVVGFVASSSYWNSYNAHLAASQCALAGLGAAAVLRIPRKTVGVALVLLILAVDLPALRKTVKDSRARMAEMLEVAQTVPAIVPKNASFFAFDPTWSLAANRLPPDDTGPVVVDTYGAMLLSAVQRGGPYPDTATAFQSAPPHAEIRARLAASDFVLLGWRGNWQLSNADLAWFSSRFRCVNPEAGPFCIWRRLEQPSRPIPIAEQIVRFGEGWYDREGLPPKTWRWMGGRSETMLPAHGEPARLELAFEIPLDRLGGAPMVAIYLDGRLLDRFTATTRHVSRTYAVNGKMLVITTDRTFNPARAGLSGDARELGLSLTRIRLRQ